jgi:hypothetical protein
MKSDPFPKLGQVVRFRKTLNAETDRGCALMAAAYLDEQLKNLISKRLVSNKKVQEKIFDARGPLGTFSSRIDFAYLLGLIGPRAQRDLHLIRNIRNSFGHTSRPLTFEEPSIANRCKELYYDAFSDLLAPRKKFIRVVLGVLGVIHACEMHSLHIKQAKDAKTAIKESAAFRKLVHVIATTMTKGKEKRS